MFWQHAGHPSRFGWRPSCRQSAVLCKSTLGLCAQFVELGSFRTDFTTHDLVISIVHQPSVGFQSRLRKSFRHLELGGVIPVPILVKKKTGWKLNEPPLTKDSKADAPPPPLPPSLSPSAPARSQSPNTFLPVPKSLRKKDKWNWLDLYFHDVSKSS